MKVSKSLKGTIFTEERKRNISLGQIGKIISEAAKKKMAEAKRGKTGAITNRWKGEDVGIKALHHWVRKYLQQPELCEFCNRNKSIDLANMTGVYNREFHNWKYLCKSCHIDYDRPRRHKRSYKQEQFPNSALKDPDKVNSANKAPSGY